jgi:hypothetical protein
VYLRNFLFPYVLDESATNYIFGAIKETLPATLDAYRIPAVVGGALGQAMPKIAAERPEIVPKLQRFGGAPLEELMTELKEKGFPSRREEWKRRSV